MADQLGNSLSYCTDSDLKHSVDTCSDLFHEDVCASLLSSRLLLLLWLLWNRLAILVVLRWHVVLLGHNRGAVLFVISIVDEHVVLLRVDHSFDQFACVITLTLKDCANNIHNLGTQGRASHEDALNDR